MESSRQRPSLLVQHQARQVAHHQLNLEDNPRHEAGFGSHRYTVLGVDTRRRSLLRQGRLTGLLDDCPDGPWRVEDARHVPQPRMSHLELAPAPSSAALDQVLGRAGVPVVRVHRLGFGSLDHRDGTVVLEVKDATCPGRKASVELVVSRWPGRAWSRSRSWHAANPGWTVRPG
ncbi:metallopeptidase TldD-related protein [Kitasatospora sp. Root107]|uniref:metallopeptidase TldD-related protein n=1 Tax=Kitasatospora sp. Root107 TaxID=1736424 RepID=UPI0035157851